MDMSTKKLKLLAESAEDLPVISAVLQDAIVRIGDIHFSKSGQALTLTASRFCHENARGGRVRTGLRLHNVTGLRARGIDRSDPDAFLVLLSLELENRQSNNLISLRFSGGGDLAAEVEILEARLMDYADARSIGVRPLHPEND